MDAKRKDIDAFKSVSRPQPGITPEMELKLIRDLKAKNPETYGHLSEDEMLAIHRYTGPDYTGLNTALRTGKGADLAKWKSYQKVLNAALSKLPRFKGEVIRGGGLPPALDAKFQVGKTVSDKAFLSSCAGTDPPLAFRGPYEFHIYSKNGRPVEDLSASGGFSQIDPDKPKYDPGAYPDGQIPKNWRADENREAEVLFASDTRFKVTGREQMRVWNGKKWENKTVIYMVEK